MSGVIEQSIDNGVLRLQISHADKRNALTQSMYRSLGAALQSAATDPSVRVVLIEGRGPCFCSGNDLDDFIDQTTSLEPIMAFLQRLAAFEKPLVAAVNGAAVGIGTTLLLHCDLVYAAEDARFQLPFVNLGLLPEGGSSLLLPAMLGHQRAAELLLLGEPFDSHKACRLGLVNDVVAGPTATERALQAALKLAHQPPQALLVAKRMLKQHRGLPLAEVIEREGQQFAAALSGEEARRALAVLRR